MSRNRDGAIFKQLETRILASTPALDAHAMRNLLNNSLCTRPFRVHVEAALMALAHYVKDTTSEGAAAAHELPSDLRGALYMVRRLHPTLRACAVVAEPHHFCRQKFPRSV